jgi:hypothetical protein
MYYSMHSLCNSVSVLIFSVHRDNREAQRATENPQSINLLYQPLQQRFSALLIQLLQ